MSLTSTTLSSSSLRERLDAPLYETSHTSAEDAVLFSSRDKRLFVVAPSHSLALERFSGQDAPFADGLVLKVCPQTSVNAAALRHTLPWLTPRPLGLKTSAGFGDRLGIATPGHVLALKRVGGDVGAIFAQQSIREMTRTGRSPQGVLDDATWGAFQAGWREQVGADADHQKTLDDLERCAAAGFTLFTVDPGAFVVSAADTTPAGALQAHLEGLPWKTLETTQSDLERRYLGRATDLGDTQLSFDRETLWCAAVKYGGAVAHVTKMYRHLAAKGTPFELEVSVDETETPTTQLEHVYIALELKRLGVAWVGLAPRFVGRFEKGVDYLGDLGALSEDLLGHAAIARALGPYKLSLHSGSDKFSVYPLIAEATEGLVHLKTAGTSYLEALRVAARHVPALFREVAAFAQGRYEQERASYHVSAELSRVPPLDTLADTELEVMLGQDDARQVLHVTFGSVLDRYKDALIQVLEVEEEAHYESLAQHFERHLKPFSHTAAEVAR